MSRRRGTRRALDGLPIAALVGLAVLLAAPLGFAQPSSVRRLGYLSLGHDGAAPFRQALLDGLRDLGYVEGRTLAVESRFADGRRDRLFALAGELVALKVEVIVTERGQATRAARQATSSIPIVMVGSSDPVGTGIVTSLARPGGNVTGLTLDSTEVSGKRLELLREVVPKLARIAVLWNAADPGKALELKELRGAAGRLGVQLVSASVQGPDDLEPQLVSIAGGKPDALLVLADPVTLSQRQRIVDFAAARRLPAMYELQEFVEAGGLMAYGASLPHLFRRAATVVDKILKGAQPGDTPVEQPMTFETALNMRTAKALGVTIPPAVRLRADRVIE